MESKRTVLMLPWLAHGHISPFLELAKILAHRNIHTHLCSTLACLNSIRAKIPAKLSTSIHLVELTLSVLPGQLPPDHHSTNGLPPGLTATLRQALDSSKKEFSRIVESLRPDLVIHDVIIQWAAGVAQSHGVPVASFLTSGAAMCSYFCHCMAGRDVAEYPFSGIRLEGVEMEMVHGYVDSYKSQPSHEENYDRTRDRGSKPAVTLINSSRSIEGKYMDYVGELVGWNGIPVGALVCVDCGRDDLMSRDLIDWLGKKDVHSAVYLSFGSEYFLKREEIEEIAHGLELSGVNFVWVVRFPAGEKVRVEEVLPEGFLDRIGERGRIMEGWAPQAQILMHASVGTFVSHCGWNSLMESVEFGVPIIAMPMHFDQPLNAKLVAELGVGIGVGRGGDGRFERREIARVIRAVCFRETGEILRRRLGEVREVLRVTREEEIQGVVQEVLRLCEMRL